jgi:putrescine transport system substrate-binding protein
VICTPTRRGPYAFQTASLAGVVACLGACLLAACTTGHKPPPDQHQVLNLYSWAEYFQPSVLHEFEAETGITVNYSVFDSNDAAETTLSAGTSGFDLVTVNASPHLGRQIPRGLWRPLDKSKLHNLGNVDAGILRMLERVDPGNRYAIPYMWGTIGLIYNPDMIRRIMPDAPVDSLDMVFRPDVVNRFRNCGVSVLSSWVDMLPIISGYLAQPELSTEPSALRAVTDTFARVRPAMRRITTSGYYDQLARGELCLAIGYSADATVAQRRAAELGHGVRIEYRAPREIVPMYIDAYAIPANARNADAALQFIDFTLRPEIGAELARATGFAIANSAAVDRLEPDLRDNQAVYPPPQVRQRFVLGRGYTMEETRVLSRAWLRVKTGH